VRHAVVLLALGLVALAAGAGAQATNECRGFMACVPIAGPWVVVPASTAVPRPQVRYQLRCPRGYVVGGVDAELTDKAIDLWFLGKSGSPIGPGTTTSRTVVFVSSNVGASARPSTFRPHAGCIPATGGGGRRTPTAVQAVVPPGEPTVMRVRTFRIASGVGFSVSCRADERLVDGFATAAFRTTAPPAAGLVAGVSLRRAFARDHVTAVARGGGKRSVVQVAAVCAGGR
jgi:hypothetical protein